MPLEFRGNLPKQRVVTIGSASDNDIIIDHPTVSRHHAIIARRGILRRRQLSDLNSTNGTVVNGRRVDRPVAFRTDDSVGIGAVKLRLDSANSYAGSDFLFLPFTLVFLFLLGFAATEYLLSQHLSPSQQSASTASINSSAVDIPSAVNVSSKSLRPAMDRAEPQHGVVESKEWLSYLNQIRSSCGLPSLVEDSQSSIGAALHARYLVKTYGDRIRAVYSLTHEEAHGEIAASPWYTATGAKAAASGDEAYNHIGLIDPAREIDDWLTGPFHRSSLLYRQLTHVGYGQYCENGACASSMTMIALQDGNWTTPIKFPANHSVTTLRSFSFHELPNPLDHCQGYTQPVGFPITLQFDRLNYPTPTLTSYSLTRNGAPVEACGFSVENQPPLVILIPRQPLLGASQYEVLIVADGHSYDWQFSTK